MLENLKIIDINLFHFFIFEALHHVGYCLNVQNNYAEAEKFLNESLVIRRTLPPQHKRSLAASKYHFCHFHYYEFLSLKH